MKIFLEIPGVWPGCVRSPDTHIGAFRIGIYCALKQYMSVVNADVRSVAVRLASNSGNRPHNAGRLEVFHNGIWGTVCNWDFDDNNAKVACYMLGFG